MPFVRLASLTWTSSLLFWLLFLAPFFFLIFSLQFLSLPASSSSAMFLVILRAHSDHLSWPIRPCFIRPWPVFSYNTVSPDPCDSPPPSSLKLFLTSVPLTSLFFPRVMFLVLGRPKFYSFVDQNLIFWVLHELSGCTYSNWIILFNMTIKNHRLHQNSNFWNYPVMMIGAIIFSVWTFG